MPEVIKPTQVNRAIEVLGTTPFEFELTSQPINDALIVGQQFSSAGSWSHTVSIAIDAIVPSFQVR